MSISSNPGAFPADEPKLRRPMVNIKRVAKIISKLSHAPEVFRAIRQCPSGLELALGYTGLKSVKFPTEFRSYQGDRIALETFEDLVTAWLVFFREDYVLPPNCKTIIDAGANIGAFSLYAARRIPGARIIALEPSPDTRSRLEANIASSGQERAIQVRPWGLAGSDGIRHFDNRPTCGSQFRSLLGDADPLGSILIETVTMQTLLNREGIDRVDLLKLDVEGAEHEIIRETSLEVLRRFEVIALEYHGRGAIEPLFARLGEAGFSMVDHNPGTEGCGIAHFKLDGSDWRASQRMAASEHSRGDSAP